MATFLFIVGLAYGLMRFLASQKEDLSRRPPVEAKRYVKSAIVEYTKIISPVAAEGRLTSVAEIDIIAEASGRILQGDVSLKKGARFSKGDVLFIIYPDEAALALKASKSQFLNTLANLLPDIKIDYPQAEEGLMEFFSSITLDDPLPPFPEIQDEKLKIFLTSRNVLSQYYTLRKDELQLSRRTVNAPFAGTFTQVNMEVGSYANTGGRVARAIKTDELELEVPVERFDAEWVKIGDKVNVVSDERGFKWIGSVIRKNEFVDPNTQSQGIFILLKNHNSPRLLAGEYYRAEFPGHPIDGVMEVPRNVVFNSDEVFVIVDDRLERRHINIIKENEKTLIFNGIDEGEILVMQPLINVLEGTLVERLEDQEAGPAREKRPDLQSADEGQGKKTEKGDKKSRKRSESKN